MDFGRISQIQARSTIRNGSWGFGIFGHSVLHLCRRLLHGFGHTQVNIFSKRIGFVVSKMKLIWNLISIPQVHVGWWAWRSNEMESHNQWQFCWSLVALCFHFKYGGISLDTLPRLNGSTPTSIVGMWIENVINLYIFCIELIESNRSNRPTLNSTKLFKIKQLQSWSWPNF